jgi:hypothetical protein
MLDRESGFFEGIIDMRILRFLLLIACLPAAAQNAAMPACGSPDAVLAHYATALGGQAALDSMQTLVMEAGATEPHTFNPASTEHDHYRFEWRAPGKVRVRQHYALTWANWIYDGQAWSLWNGKLSHNDDATPEQQKKLKVLPYNDDPQFLMFRVAANPLLVATTRNLYRRYALAPGASGTCVLAAFGTSAWGERRDALTFNAENGLLKTWAIETGQSGAGQPGEPAQVSFQFDDYQPAGNLLVPRLLFFDFYGTAFRINRVAVNASVDDAGFVPRP